MLKTVKILLISSAGIAYSVSAQNSAPPPAAPPAFSDDTKVDPATLDPAAGVAQLLGIDKNAAAERLELQRKAVDWANALIADPPAAFVDMELQQTPNFKINLYFSKDVTPGEIISSAPNDIRRYI